MMRSPFPALLVFLSMGLNYARGAIYELTDPLSGPSVSGGEVSPLPLRILRDRLTDLRLEQPDSRLRKDLEKRRADLASKKERSIAEDIDLSACLIRLRQYSAAIDL